MYTNFFRHISAQSFLNVASKSKRKPRAPNLHPYTKRKKAADRLDMEASYDRNRRWETSSATSSSSCNETQEAPDITKKYKLLSYNILAQDLLVEHIDLYMTINQQLLLWRNRLRNLQREIVCLNPDILCLQEMQFDHLQELLLGIKGKKRLEYIFKKKTGSRTDGCAIIYDRDKFQLHADRTVEYYQEGHFLLNRENVAVMAKFNLRDEPGKQLIVATTHLLYNPRRDDVRSAQVEVLLAALREFSLSDKEPLRIPTIITGDFNFEPDNTTYSLVTASAQTEQTAIKEEQQPAECNVESQQFQSIQFGDCTASTYQNKWITVDYVLHSIGDVGRQVKIWSQYNLPTVDDCYRSGRIPNSYIGSDHYSLAVLFSVV